MAANALKGSIASDDLVVSKSLIEINLSYNKLTGTIPKGLQNLTIDKLDLSHNEIAGIFNYSGRPSIYENSSLVLSYNRLSGIISNLNRFRFILLHVI